MLVWSLFLPVWWFLDSSILDSSQEGSSRLQPDWSISSLWSSCGVAARQASYVCGLLFHHRRWSWLGHTSATQKSFLFWFWLSNSSTIEQCLFFCTTQVLRLVLAHSQGFSQPRDLEYPASITFFRCLRGLHFYQIVLLIWADSDPE